MMGTDSYNVVSEGERGGREVWKSRQGPEHTVFLGCGREFALYLKCRGSGGRAWRVPGCPLRFHWIALPEFCLQGTASQSVLIRPRPL